MLRLLESLDFWICRFPCYSNKKKQTKLLDMEFFMNETYMTSHVHKFTCALCFDANKIADKKFR